MKKCPDCNIKLHIYSDDPENFWYECEKCWCRYDKEAYNEM